MDITIATVLIATGGSLAGAAIGVAGTLWVMRKQIEHATAMQAEQLRHQTEQQGREHAFDREREARRWQADTAAELQDQLGLLLRSAQRVAAEQHRMMDALPADDPLSGTVTATTEWYEYRDRYLDVRQRVVVLANRLADVDLRQLVAQLVRSTDQMGASTPRQWLFAREVVKQQLRDGKPVELDPEYEAPNQFLDINKQLGALIRHERDATAGDR